VIKIKPGSLASFSTTLASKDRIKSYLDYIQEWLNPIFAKVRIMNRTKTAEVRITHQDGEMIVVISDPEKDIHTFEFTNPEQGQQHEEKEKVRTEENVTPELQENVPGYWQWIQGDPEPPK
jgi:hypothetical protein